MNGFGIDVDDNHKMILQNMELVMEDMMDQGWMEWCKWRHQCKWSI
jgi:hypothetical protein